MDLAQKHEMVSALRTGKGKLAASLLESFAGDVLHHVWANRFALLKLATDSLHCLSSSNIAQATELVANLLHGLSEGWREVRRSSDSGDEGNSSHRWE